MYKKSIEEFSNLAASKEPVPGGGAVSSLVASLASSLAMMVTNLTIGKEKYLAYTVELKDIKAELDILRKNLLECINKDAEDFLPLANAYKISKDDPSREETLETCLKKAVEAPIYILKYASRIIDLDERLAIIGSKISVSDAGTSVILALGALKGAYLNVIVNTKLMKDKTYAKKIEDEMKEILDEYTIKANQVYEDVLKRLTNG